MNSEEYYVKGKRYGIDFRTKGGKAWKKFHSSYVVKTLSPISDNWNPICRSAENVYRNKLGVVGKVYGSWEREGIPSVVSAHYSLSNVGISPLCLGVSGYDISEECHYIFFEDLNPYGFETAMEFHAKNLNKYPEYLKVLNSSILSSLSLGYCHPDLHDENVMCRIYKNRVEVKLIDWDTVEKGDFTKSPVEEAGDLLERHHRIYCPALSPFASKSLKELFAE